MFTDFLCFLYILWTFSLFFISGCCQYILPDGGSSFLSVLYFDGHILPSIDLIFCLFLCSLFFLLCKKTPLSSQVVSNFPCNFSLSYFPLLQLSPQWVAYCTCSYKGKYFLFPCGYPVLIPPCVKMSSFRPSSPVPSHSCSDPNALDKKRWAYDFYSIGVFVYHIVNSILS